MTRAESLLRERSKLVEAWRDQSASERAKLLVKIMDIEEEVNYTKQTYLKRRFKPLY